MKKQRVPRHFKKLIATIHVQTSVTEPGDKVEVTYIRDGKEATAVITLTKLES